MNKNYTYKLEQFAGRNCILIEDLNSGGKSITNDIENIVAEISGIEHIDPAHFMIVYKDSCGYWDGWDHINNDFVSLFCDNAHEAIRTYIGIQLNTSLILHNKTKKMQKDPKDGEDIAEAPQQDNDTAGTQSQEVNSDDDSDDNGALAD